MAFIRPQRFALAFTTLLAIYSAALVSTSVAADEEQKGEQQKEARPPFRGTIFDFPDLMKESDATAFTGLKFVEQGHRNMFDRRLDRFEQFSVFVFEATYADGKPIEVAVNREFETEVAAQKQAEFYATAFGRLPLFLRQEIDALHIQAGDKLFGGGRNVLIHVEQGEAYQRDGILEETLGHEAAHALDQRYAREAGWLAAQKKDASFISSYAKENPFREDIAESVIPYFAVRMRPERITAEQRQKIEQSIPARIAYLDELKPAGFFKLDDSQNEKHR